MLPTVLSSYCVCRCPAGQRTCFAVFAFIHVDPWQELLHQMNSTTAPPVIGDRQRLSATMVLSLLLHVMLILGVGFALDDDAPVLPTLDAILTQPQTQLARKSGVKVKGVSIRLDL